MRILLNIAEIACYVYVVINFFGGDVKKAMLFFAGGIFLSFFKKLFKM